MPLTAGVTVIDNADRQSALGWFVGVITTTIWPISHVERSAGRTASGSVANADLVVNLVKTCGEIGSSCNTKWPLLTSDVVRNAGWHERRSAS